MIICLYPYMSFKVCSICLQANNHIPVLIYVHSYVGGQIIIYVFSYMCTHIWVRVIIIYLFSYMCTHI